MRTGGARRATVEPREVAGMDGGVEPKLGRVQKRKAKRLERYGPKFWRSMEDFLRYVRDWQDRTKVKLIHEDSKGAESHNVSNKLKPGDVSFIPLDESKLAYKSWTCVHGRKRKRAAVKVGRKSEDGSRSLCGFKVRARYVPALKHVTCTVTLHDGPDACQNGHNHPLEAPRPKVVPDGGRVRDLLTEDPNEAVATMSLWGVNERRKFCETVLRDVAQSISDPDKFTVRRMVEFLSMVTFVAVPPNARSRKAAAEEGTESED